MTRSLVAAVSVAVLSVLAVVAGAVWLVVGGPGTQPGPDGADLPVASVEDFCGVFLDPFPLLDEVGGDQVDLGENYREYADRMVAVGLPDGASPRVREGLVVFATLSQDLPADPVAARPGELPQPDAREDDAYRAFDRWARRTCGKPF